MFGTEFRLSFKFCLIPKEIKTWVKKYSDGGMIKCYIIIDITITIKTLQSKNFDILF